MFKVRPIGYDGNNPTSVAEWLESLELGDYTKSFLINGYTSMELVKKIWEIELINVSPAYVCCYVLSTCIYLSLALKQYVQGPHSQGKPGNIGNLEKRDIQTWKSHGNCK